MDQQTIADYPVGGAATTPTFRYVYASYIDEPVVRKTAGTGGTLVYFHRNQQYSITAVTTSAGSIAERYAYTAYGLPTILDSSASVLSSSAINNRYTYTGREWDATLGLHHFRARWMSPSAGRFLTRDPIGYVDGWSLYPNYFEMDGVDPTGLADLDADPSGPEGVKWCNRKFRPREILGRTNDIDYRVECGCVCCDNNYCDPKRRIQCRVIVRFDISIALDNLANAPRSVRDRFSKEKIYGHEQRHIRNLLDNAKEVQRLLSAAEKSIGCIPVNTCPARAKTMQDIANAWMKKYSDEEKRHTRAEPAENTPYDPIGVMPAEDCSDPSEVKPIPKIDCKDGF
jgi:RHS repeat-associated protein